MNNQRNQSITFQELYCYVLEDSQRFPEMISILEIMCAIRQLRETAMQMINRHSSVVLDCGIYCSHAPAPNPILRFDTCWFPLPFIIHLFPCILFNICACSSLTVCVRKINRVHTLSFLIIQTYACILFR